MIGSQFTPQAYLPTPTAGTAPLGGAAAPAQASAAGGGKADGSVGLLDGVFMKALLGGGVGAAAGFVLPFGPILGGVIGAVAGAGVGIFMNFRKIKKIRDTNAAYLAAMGVQPQSQAEANALLAGNVGQAGQSPQQGMPQQGNPAQGNPAQGFPTQTASGSGTGGADPATGKDPAVAPGQSQPGQKSVVDPPGGASDSIIQPAKIDIADKPSPLDAYVVGSDGKTDAQRKAEQPATAPPATTSPPATGQPVQQQPAQQPAQQSAPPARPTAPTQQPVAPQPVQQVQQVQQGAVSPAPVTPGQAPPTPVVDPSAKAPTQSSPGQSPVASPKQTAGGGSADAPTQSSRPVPTSAPPAPSAPPGASNVLPDPKGNPVPIHTGGGVLNKPVTQGTANTAASSAAFQEHLSALRQSVADATPEQRATLLAAMRAELDNLSGQAAIQRRQQTFAA